MTYVFNQETVLAELADDQKQAMDQLFNHYYPRLYNFSKSFLKDEEGIDDILQEVFIKLWENRKTIKSSETFNAFLFTITRNLLLNEIRSRLNNQNFKDKIKNLAVSEEYNHIENIEYQELKTRVDQIINELSTRRKEVFVLSRGEGLSHKEIAEKLNISEKTVEYHIHESINFIKGKLKSLELISLLYLYLFL